MTNSIASNIIDVPGGAHSASIVSFSGDPNSVGGSGLPQSVGSLCLRTDNQTIYLKTTGGTSGWTLVASATSPRVLYDIVLSVSVSGAQNNWAPGTLGRNTLILAAIGTSTVINGLAGG